jgi:hypothetical protein
MDHADALGQIEIAAVEPGGLERLMAGDTPEAAAVAGHLAGCPACVDELARIRRTSSIAREVIQAEPDPGLRGRTLAFVAAVGRDRSAASATAPAPGAGAPRGRWSAPVAAAGWLPTPLAVGAIAAVLVVAAVLGFVAGRAWTTGQPEGGATEVAVLQNAATTAVRIAAQPDARHVELTPTNGGDATGSLVFSPTTGELVVTATGLKPVAVGEQYGCWVEAGGQRQRLGRMYWAGDLWTWAGTAPGLAGLPDGALFGVSLGEVGGGGSPVPVLTGRL